MCLITTDPQGSPSQLTLLVNNQCSQITANRLILLAIFFICVFEIGVFLFLNTCSVAPDLSLIHIKIPMIGEHCRVIAQLPQK
ncbi:hypothetical protein VCSRO76_0253 [Vibrio cholerae]|nr:hypothetical protein VCSRO76_0253 [Vibrio cholerae]GIA15543.1 hypothetical protein VCSRO13_1994 [Vibrio cholerae]GIB40120.1 hypothetical protein VCSRO46_0083 [Vibrio cholerae]GIB62390.1 hypothetical protein VCSRO47_2273 [Vibrio cholerae]